MHHSHDVPGKHKSAGPVLAASCKGKLAHKSLINTARFVHCSLKCIVYIYSLKLCLIPVIPVLKLLIWPLGVPEIELPKTKFASYYLFFLSQCADVHTLLRAIYR